MKTYKIVYTIANKPGRHVTFYEAACADFAAFSSPEAFIFFGGLTKAGDYLMKPLKEKMLRKKLI